MSLVANYNTKIFISYAEEDIEVARKLYEYLKEFGLEPWFDKESLLPGEKWRPAIKNAIQNSRYFIALFSSNSVEARGYVQKQLKEALDILDEFPPKDRFIIPVRLDDCKVSDDRVTELYMVDLFRDWDSAIEKILKAMNIDSSILRSSLRKSGVDTYAPKENRLTVNLSGVYWNKLLTRIDQQKCIPFIGPNASSFARDDGQPCIPSNIEVAKEWIKEHDYPFGGSSDLSEKCIEEQGFPIDGSYQLARVAQFLAIEKNDEMFPKFVLSDYLSKRESPDFSLPRYKNTPYALLADLDLKIYITTNYDLLMEKALISRKKVPVSEFCRWNDDLLEIPSRIGKHSRYKPEKDKPLVFHLHGAIRQNTATIAMR